jgi:hypothetical protein
MEDQTRVGRSAQSSIHHPSERHNRNSDEMGLVWQLPKPYAGVPHPAATQSPPSPEYDASVAKQARETGPAAVMHDTSPFLANALTFELAAKSRPPSVRYT